MHRNPSEEETPKKLEYESGDPVPKEEPNDVWRELLGQTFAYVVIAVLAVLLAFLGAAGC